MLNGVPAMAPLEATGMFLVIWWCLGVTAAAAQGVCLPAERKDVHSFLHLLKPLHISAQSDGVAGDRGAKAVTTVTVKTALSPSKQTLEPSGSIWLAELSACGCNRGTGHRFLCFKTHMRGICLNKAENQWFLLFDGVCACVFYTAARSTRVDMSCRELADRMVMASRSHSLMSVTTWSNQKKSHRNKLWIHHQLVFHVSQLAAVLL